MTTVLKQNEYKCVELHEPVGEPAFITKRYSGQGAAQDRINTQYIDQALHFFHKEFGDILTAPRPLSTNLDKCEVTMEFLSGLPKAKGLSLGDLPKARSFFEHCYAITDDRGFLRTVDDSVMATPAVKELLSSNFPLSLGFKGDLTENLCLGQNELILADIDSIAIEPLGLSELIVYAQRFASSHLHPALKSLVRMPTTPVAYKKLNEAQARALNDATLTVIQLTMTTLPDWLKSLKVNIARYLLDRMANSYYD